MEAIANPVSLARKVMEDTPHCILAGEGALKFAKKSGFPVLENPLELATAESHERSKEASYYLGKAGKWVNADAPDVNGTITGQGFDTVGAVAVDSKGRLASATSTGENPAVNSLANSSTSTLCNVDSSLLLKEAGIVAESYLVTLFSLLMDLLNLEGHVCRLQDILFC